VSAKLYYLLEELKEKRTQQLVEETWDCMRTDIIDLYEDIDKSTELLNGQPRAFYKKMAEQFIIDLQEVAELFFFTWDPKFYFFTPKTMNEFFDICLEMDDNTEATDFINGFIEMYNDRPEIALFHFNRIDDYVAYYFIAMCYLRSNNYENAIINYLEFMDNFLKFSENVKEEGMDMEDNSSFNITKWNIYNDLGYLYNRVEDYHNAALNYEKGLKLASLEENYLAHHNDDNKESVDDFTIFVNNYLMALEKTNKVKKAIEVLHFVLSKKPNDLNYKTKLKKFVEKSDKHSFADEIISSLFRPKKPFNLSKFEETKLVSKEKALEDLIIEQIKYGIQVFHRNLEIYNENKIYGRQYYIQNSKGILDLLLIEKSTNTLFIVELKRNEAGIEVVAQIENYIDGLSKQLNREVKGIICLHKPDIKLKELVKTKPHIELFTYQFAFVKEG
jgi:tetratricopeptide (TPR) repeat protein